MTGRTLPGIAAALLGLGAVLGCDEGGSAPEPTPTASPAAGCVRAAVGTPDVTLRPGPTEGMPRSTAAGEALVVDAVVLDKACQPAAGAELRVWHTDARGLYGPNGGADCCFYEARGKTDQSGRFRLETIRPAQYPVANAPAAHIHVEIDGTAVTLVFGFGSPPATVTATSGPVTIPLSHDSAGWRGEATVVI